MKKPVPEVVQAKLTLLRLLRTPKSRSGLIAAVKGTHVTRNFVYGYLAEQVRAGKVVVLKSGISVMYQAASRVVQETAAPASFPTWLEPRNLPLAGGRRVYIDGVEVDPDAPKKEEDDETDF